MRHIAGGGESKWILVDELNHASIGQLTLKLGWRQRVSDSRQKPAQGLPELAGCTFVIPPRIPADNLPFEHYGSVSTDHRRPTVISVTERCSRVNGQRAGPIDSTTEAARMLKIIEHDACHRTIDRQNWILTPWADDFELGGF
jgi:hypothetical protein